MELSASSKLAGITLRLEELLNRVERNGWQITDQHIDIFTKIIDAWTEEADAHSP